MSEQDYPYVGEEREICLKDNRKFVMGARGFAYLPKNEEEMKKMVALYGPISVSVAASNWPGGIYKAIMGAADCNGDLNHGVLIVGYGSEKGQAYWLVKNSWGSDFGDKGYIKIERGANACQIASEPLIAVF